MTFENCFLTPVSGSNGNDLSPLSLSWSRLQSTGRQGCPVTYIFRIVWTVKIRTRGSVSCHAPLHVLRTIFFKKNMSLFYTLWQCLEKSGMKLLPSSGSHPGGVRFKWFTVLMNHAQPCFFGGGGGSDKGVVVFDCRVMKTLVQWSMR